MTVQGSEPEFLRPSLNVSRDLVTDPSAIQSLTDLISFDAEHNADHVFALQEVRKGGKHVELTPVTFGELRNAAAACAQLLRKRLPVDPFEAKKGEKLETPRPVVLFLESDINLFVHLAALLFLNIPVLVLSIRLSPAAILHLLQSTSARAIIVSQRTQETMEKALQVLSLEQKQSLELVQLLPFKQLIHLAPVFTSEGLDRRVTSDQETAIILHSSGTTGLPKPIVLAHRYLLGYAACHRLEPSQCLGKRNVSTLPMYHGFGLLGPCISLATGKTCCFPSASVIPSASSVAELIEKSASSSLMTVPSVLDEFKDNSGLMKALIGLDFVAVGGGAIKPALGELLVSSGVKLLNHYGATEIGAIAPISVPGEDYDWNYLRIRTDMGLEINEVEKVDENGDPLYQLVGYPFGWGSSFVVQDLLRRRPGSAYTEVAILGRNDDLLVLSTGEKILPNQLETRLCGREGVKTALVFGQDREEVGVLIEPEEHLRNTEVEHFVERMWSVLLEENNSLDRHARIASKGMILIKDADKAWPRTDKGSIMRRETYNLFAEEIAEVYAASGPSDSFSFSLGSNLDEIISNLRAMVQSCVQDRDISVADWADSDDWFELGMDSLEATRLARMLNHVSDKDSFPALTRQKLQPAFIYQHPNFKVLSEYLLADTTGEETNGHSSHSAIDQMIDLVSKYTPARSSGWVILLTGATGHLGAHLLEQLSRNSNVSQVICLSRLRQQQDPQYRQQQANNRHRITLSEAAWAKVRFLTSSQLHQPDLGLLHKEYRRLVQTVTHIVHNAWPMDFQRSLSSFEAQIQAVRRLVILCEECQKKPRHLPSPRLLFTSSIAVGARNSSGRLPEEPISDPSTTANLGYAQAKWVCEQIIIGAAKSRGDLLHPSIVRLGQLTGGMISGIWNSNEHFPALLKASQIIGSLPELNGSFSWIPIDIAAKSIVEILFSRPEDPAGNIVYHIENPIRQAWNPLLPVLASKLGLKVSQPVPFETWLERASSLADTEKDSDFIHHLLPFLREDFQSLSSGGVILETTRARRVSRSLRGCNGVSLELLNFYIESWRKENFLQ